MNYRYHGLKKKKSPRGSISTEGVRNFLKRLGISLKKYKFDSKDPILVFDFINRFHEECDIRGMTDAQNYLELPSFLIVTEWKQYSASRNVREYQPRYYLKLEKLVQ